MKHWVEISAPRLKANYACLQRAASCTAVLAVIKANAYGHGAALCAPILAEAQAPWLGVADTSEAKLVLESLARYSNPPRILIMSGFLPEDAAAIVAHGFTPAVWHRQQLDWLLAAAQPDTRPIAIHLEIDTGMSRQGVAPGEHLTSLLHFVKANPRLHLEAVFTHFASAEVAGSSLTRLQRLRFEKAIAAVAHNGFRPTWIHAGNSSTLDADATDNNLHWLRTLASTVGAQTMVRAGIALYGYCLPIEADGFERPAPPVIQPSLRPVLTWKTRIIGLRDLHTHDTVGYNAIFSAPRPMRLALLPVGYADGLRRELSASNAHPGGWVMIHGERAPIVGRISMNLVTVDVTHIHGLQLGDEVTLLGDGISADDHARIVHTIPYEILCGIGAVAHQML